MEKEETVRETFVFCEGKQDLSRTQGGGFRGTIAITGGFTRVEGKRQGVGFLLDVFPLQSTFF